MSTLDTRARAASASVTTAVADYTPRSGFATVAARRQRARRVGTALAGGFAVIVLLLGSWLRGPTPEPDAANVSTTVPVIEQTTPVIGDAAPPILETPDPDTPGPDQIAPEPAPLALPPVAPAPTGSGDEPVKEAAEPLPEDKPVVEEPVEPADTTPPRISITTPADGAKLTEKVASFQGKTEPGARVMSGPYEANVSADGRWSIRLVLREGPNGARFTAIDEAGNEATARITVFYEPEEPVKDDPPPKVEFTASATYGSCAFDPPYDVYFGTAEPGSKIAITSAFGSGTTEADAEGHWEKKVFFAEAPIGETFLVTVKDRYGTKKKFEFTALASG